MSRTHLQRSIEAILEGNVNKATAMFKRSLELKLEHMVKEDHEKSMSEPELKHYIKDLHSKARDEHKEAFAKHLEADECSDEAFSKAASKHCKSKVKADHLIHKLEKLVGSKIDPKEYKTDKKEGETDSQAEVESKMKKGQVKESKKIKWETKCPECNGKGEHEDLKSAKNNDNPVECSHCAGSGYIKNMDSHLPVKEAVNAAHTHEVVDNQTGSRVGTYSNSKRAHAVADKKDLDHGAIRYSVRPIKSSVKEADEIKQDILNELKASTLGSYVKKAASDAADHAHLAGETPKGLKAASFRNKANAHEEKRHKGIAKATDKLVKKAK